MVIFVSDVKFKDIQDTLDALMKERTRVGMRVGRRQAEINHGRSQSRNIAQYACFMCLVCTLRCMVAMNIEGFVILSVTDNFKNYVRWTVEYREDVSKLIAVDCTRLSI